MLHFNGRKLVCLFMALTLGLLITSTALAGSDPPTLRVYGNNGEGAGDPKVRVEDPPYSDLASIFDPTGPQAPRKDSVTWNPVWMYEDETLDESQVLGLYRQLYADGINASEKVWFRMWYEPDHKDKDVNYPAIMEEFTYVLMEADRLANVPDPISGPAGRTQFVFPIGISEKYLYDPYGYSLTTLDADFDCVPDIVEVDSEKTLTDKTGVAGDFSANGQLDSLDPDMTPLTGDELVILSITPKELTAGRRVQFLDHVVEVMDVTSSGVTVRIWYTGDLQPRDLGFQNLGIAELRTYRTRLPGVQAPAPSGVNLGPFFIQVTKVDMEDGVAQIRVGRYPLSGCLSTAATTGSPIFGQRRDALRVHQRGAQPAVPGTTPGSLHGDRRWQGDGGSS